MARLATVAALLLVMVALGEASIFRTTVTTTEIDSLGLPPVRKGHEQCRKQLHRAQYLEQCMNYLDQQQEQEQEFNIPFPVRKGGSLQQKCCDQLQQLSSECRCQGIQQIVEEMSEDSQQQQQGGQQRHLLWQAQKLPGMCQLEPQQCEIQQY